MDLHISITSKYTLTFKHMIFKMDYFELDSLTIMTIVT
jgi:hypothetical protein